MLSYTGRGRSHRVSVLPRAFRARRGTRLSRVRSHPHRHLEAAPFARRAGGGLRPPDPAAPRNVALVRGAPRQRLPRGGGRSRVHRVLRALGQHDVSGNARDVRARPREAQRLDLGRLRGVVHSFPDDAHAPLDRPDAWRARRRGVSVGHSRRHRGDPLAHATARALRANPVRLGLGPLRDVWARASGDARRCPIRWENR
jgi:hypothetical protein